MLSKTNSLQTIEDIRMIFGDVKIYVVNYKDNIRSGISFSRPANNFNLILEYTLDDPRGILGYFYPNFVTGVPEWSIRSTVRITENLEDPEIASTYYIGTISSGVYYNYNRWILNTWIPQNPNFSIYDGESTGRKFLEDSLNYFKNDVVVAGLSLPIIRTYKLKWANSDLISLNSDQFGICLFYGGLDLNNYSDILYIMSTSDTIYKYDPTLYTANGLKNLNYWKYTKPVIETNTNQLRIDPTLGMPSNLLYTPAGMYSGAIVTDLPTNHSAENNDKASSLTIIVLLFLLIITFVVIIVIIYYIDFKAVVPTDKIVIKPMPIPTT